MLLYVEMNVRFPAWWPDLVYTSFGASYLAMFIRQIAYYKIPRYIKFVDEYPMTASGKVSEVNVISLKIDC